MSQFYNQLQVSPWKALARRQTEVRSNQKAGFGSLGKAGSIKRTGRVTTKGPKKTKVEKAELVYEKSIRQREVA